MQDELLAGAVEIDITPPVGGGFDGYAARTGVSLGVHDPLLAQLLLLKAGDQQAVLITMDLLGVGLDFTGRVREGIEQAIGVPPERVMIACSHTHSGAAGFLPPHPGIPTVPDPELQRTVERQLVGAAIWAARRLQPARLGVGKGHVQGIGLNRNDPQQEVDDEVTVLRLDGEDRQPLAVVMNYGCHPTVLGYQNQYYSADYPGAGRSTLHQLYPGAVFMFTNGASGDVSARFTRREQSFNEVDRMGRLLAGETLKVMQMIQTHTPVELAGQVAPVELKFRPFPDPELAQRELDQLQAALDALKAAGAGHGDIRRATTQVEGAAGQALMAKELAGRLSNHSQVQFLQIGDLVLAGLPGEAFTQTVLEIKKSGLFPFMAVVSYANDYQGYFPDAISISKGSYEALISPYGPDVADNLREAAIQAIRKGKHV
jgi:neutral ceramidase